MREMEAGRVRGRSLQEGPQGGCRPSGACGPQAPAEGTVAVCAARRAEQSLGTRTPRSRAWAQHQPLSTRRTCPNARQTHHRTLEPESLQTIHVETMSLHFTRGDTTYRH